MTKAEYIEGMAPCKDCGEPSAHTTFGGPAYCKKCWRVKCAKTMPLPEFIGMALIGPLMGACDEGVSSFGSENAGKIAAAATYDWLTANGQIVVPVDVLKTVNDALKWYGMEAASACQEMTKTDANPDVLLATLTVLANDAGQRAGKAMIQAAQEGKDDG